MTNPNNAVGTNAAFSGRTTPFAFNDVLAALSGAGILSGWACSPLTGMTVQLGGDGETRDVAIATEPTGNRTTINNRTSSPVPVTLAESPEVGARIDTIVAYVANPQEITGQVYGDNPEICGIIAVQGTADASSPTRPDDSTIRSAITADGTAGETAYYVELAYINVVNGVETITADVIQPGKVVSAAGGDDGTTISIKIESQSWTALDDSSPYNFKATVSAGYNITANTLVELYNDQAVLFANYGFAIGSVDSSSNSLEFYALEQPAEEVTLTVNFKEIGGSEAGGGGGVVTQNIYQQITSAYNAGTGATDFPVGTLIDVTLGRVVQSDIAGDLVMRITGTSGVITVDGQQKQGRPQLQAVRVLDTPQAFGSTDASEQTEWQNSTLRTYLNETWLNTLPRAFRNAVQTTVVSTCPNDQESATTTNDKVFIFSETELGGVGSGTQYVEGYQQEYYPGTPSNDDETLNALRVAEDSTSTARAYWTRTCEQDYTSVYVVGTDGKTDTAQTPTSTQYVRPSVTL